MTPDSPLPFDEAWKEAAQMENEIQILIFHLKNQRGQIISISSYYWK